MNILKAAAAIALAAMGSAFGGPENVAEAASLSAGTLAVRTVATPASEIPAKTIHHRRSYSPSCCPYSWCPHRYRHSHWWCPYYE